MYFDLWIGIGIDILWVHENFREKLNNLIRLHPQGPTPSKYARGASLTARKIRDKFWETKVATPFNKKMKSNHIYMLAAVIGLIFGSLLFYKLSTAYHGPTPIKIVGSECGCGCQIKNK